MTNENKSFRSNVKQMRPKWGSDTGVVGQEDTRQVLLNELNNYRRITHMGFNFYLAIIDTEHPKFVRHTNSGVERWRMRFNVFASGFFSEWQPNTVLHIGELHVYYDLNRSRSRPWCSDFTFYYDDREIGSQIISNRYELMVQSFRDSLTGKNQVLKYLLFLPINRSEFVSPNESLDKFMDCQNKIMERLEFVKKGDQFDNDYGRDEDCGRNQERIIKTRRCQSLKGISK